MDTYVRPFFQRGSAEWSNGWWHGYVVGTVGMIPAIIVVMFS